MVGIKKNNQLKNYNHKSLEETHKLPRYELPRFVQNTQREEKKKQRIKMNLNCYTHIARLILCNSSIFKICIL